ncbi:MAG: uroporphyrinogen decarboxylase family protein [Gemmatales bacterium]|nr:uroporphyrinogen decarboxylase family protein [Gemmatales bacterium]MDW8388442.1 uroporphyrinogen decarboxylase family protein [Gemmatales bacterium]
MSEPRHLLLRAIRGLPVPRPPVWAMRQAGRWDPEFNRLRSNLTFYEFSENAELSAQASLLPKRFGVDAIILFYDITTLTVAMGQRYKLIPDRGPVPDRPIRSAADVQALNPHPDAERFGHVTRILELVKRELAGELPVLVFAGAPFTLASYALGVGKDLTAIRRFVQEQPGTWDALLERLAEAAGHFLAVLARQGADAYQLFDSWAGELTEAEYLQWALPWHRMIFQKAGINIPSILFVKECPYLEHMLAAGADVISLGTRHDLAALRRQYPEQAFQGNVSDELLRSGTPEQVAEATRQCLRAGGGHRHIVNLSHGLDRETPVANFVAFVQAVREYSGQ